MSPITRLKCGCSTIALWVICGGIGLFISLVSLPITFSAGLDAFRRTPARYSAQTIARAKADIERFHHEEAQAKAAREVAEQTKRKETERDELLRTFAMQELPESWQTVQSLRVALQSQQEALEDLNKTLQLYGHSPQTDVDFRELSAEHAQLRALLDGLVRKLEDAYFAYLRYQALPNRASLRAAYQQATEVGIDETVFVRQRYQALLEAK